MKKALFIMLSAALIVCATVAGTLAWLTDTTDPVVNTFTVGDINITLTESEILNLKGSGSDDHQRPEGNC